MRACVCLLIAVALAGCGRNPEKAKYDDVFVTWFKAHGETNVVVDSTGVGIGGNRTRFEASIYGMETNSIGWSAEMELHVKLPEGGDIVEYVAGTGKTKEQAIAQATGNFVLTTLHVVYKGFINPADSHQRVQRIIIDAKPREMFAGNLIQLGDPALTNLDELSAQNEALVAALPLPVGAHWVKIVYGQNHKKPMLVAATLDNNDAPDLTAAVQNSNWPQRKEFYMVKQFILVK